MADINPLVSVVHKTATTYRKREEYRSQDHHQHGDMGSQKSDVPTPEHQQFPKLAGSDAVLLEPADDEWRAAEKSLVRKLDMLLLPTLWLLFLFNYLDRNNISQAKLSSFEADLGLVGNQFNVAVSLLNVGYMLMQLPSNMILTLARPSLYIPFWTSLWSIISASTAAADNFGHLVGIRFVLGFVEAPFSPGAIYLLTCWYPRRELALRISVFLTGVPIATALSGIIAAGVLGGLEGAHGIAGWQWLFIIEGAASFAFALLSLLLLPDFPGQRTRRWSVMCWLITDREMEVAADRIRRDRVSLPLSSKSGIWHGLRLALSDMRTWIFVLMMMANHGSYGFINFFPTIVKGFKLGGNITTLLLTAPPYIFSALVTLYVGVSSDRRQERGWHIALPQVVACAGFILTAATTNGPARYAAAFLYIPGSFASLAPAFSWASSTLGETPQERACAIAVINLISQLGNIASPYFFPSTDAPRYLMANMLMMMCSAIVVIASVVIKTLLKRANARLREQQPGATLYTL